MERNFENLSGRTFERWTVGRDYEIVHGQRKWNCQCACGTNRMVLESNLLSGKSKSCGCLSSELSKQRYRDLTNEPFGYLTAKHRDGYLHGRVAWFCECKCGNTCRATAHDLVEGHKTSCGCKMHEKGGKKMKNLRNQRMGKRIVALYPTDKRDYKGSVVWHCHCDCGNEIDFSEDSLVHGKYQSCGCLREDAEFVASNFNKGRHFYEGTCVESLGRKTRVDNKSGCTGVYRQKNNTYKVGITFQGVRYYLGVFDNFEDAVRVRKRAEQELHQDFADCYIGWLKYCRKTGWDVPFEFQVIKERGGYSIQKGSMPWMQSITKKMVYAGSRQELHTAKSEEELNGREKKSPSYDLSASNA